MTANIDFDGVPMNMAMHLLDLHWKRLHLIYLQTYRPAIMDSLINNGPYVSKLLLNAIYLQSNDGHGFYERFKTQMVGLVICGTCLVPYGRQDAGGVYCGMAYRMMVHLGYHLNIPKTLEEGSRFGLSATDMEIRRRVYWGAYVSDKYQSLWVVDTVHGLGSSTSYPGSSRLSTPAEQAFLNRVHFDFTLDQASREGSRKKCIEAAFKIWRLLESYKKTFTLRHAHYGEFYAAYSAVFVILQQGPQDHDEYIECIKFFWSMLSEPQRGSLGFALCLKKPFRLLKSFMRRIKSVAQHINVDEPANPAHGPL
ncbi:Fc.00g010610.m01.CDS01 [Cosmosporella sp. VM-42]